MDRICRACGARHYDAEVTAGDRNVFTSCCDKGKVGLPPYRDLPPEVDILYPRSERDGPAIGVGVLPPVLQNTSLAHLQHHFQNNIRHYNGALAFASLRASSTIFPGRTSPTFKIHGQLYHLLPAAEPGAGVAPSFGQLYFIDTEEALQHQLQGRSREPIVGGQLNPSLMLMLNDVIRRINPYAMTYVQVGQLVRQERAMGREVPNLEVGFAQEGAPRIRNLQAPSVAEIAAVFPEDVGAESMHEFVVHLFGEGGEVRSTSLPAVLSVIDPLCYPLLFPHGDPGWYVTMRSDTERGRFRVSMRQYYSYRMADRGVSNVLHRAGQ